MFAQLASHPKAFVQVSWSACVRVSFRLGALDEKGRLSSVAPPVKALRPQLGASMSGSHPDVSRRGGGRRGDACAIPWACPPKAGLKSDPPSQDASLLNSSLRKLPDFVE